MNFNEIFTIIGILSGSYIISYGLIIIIGHFGNFKLTKKEFWSITILVLIISIIFLILFITENNI